MLSERQRITPERARQFSLVARILLISLFVLLFFIFWNLQVIQHEHYQSRALQNIIRHFAVKAPRGLITDRHGNILAKNKLKFRLFIVPEAVTDSEKTAKQAHDLTGIPQKQISDRLNQALRNRQVTRIPLKKGIGLESVIYVESRADRLPEFAISVEPARTYPNGTVASHILGYVSEITPADLKRPPFEEYRQGDEIGMIGIERTCEEYLRGTKGRRTVIQDNRGRIQDVVSMVEPHIGAEIRLTIDLDLQRFIETIFAPYHGCVGVLDVTSGEVLALVVHPNFSPEVLSGYLERNEWLAIANNPERPLHNKFIQGFYSPGSVFKIVMTLAALKEKVITPRTTIWCSGAVSIYNRMFHCWKPGGHGNVNLSTALRDSCNIYFYQIGKQLDIDVIADYARQLGLGDATGIDLPGEQSGLVPDRRWKEEQLREKWYPGETISIAIGGGMLTVTPVQMLKLIATTALRGKSPNLHLVKAVAGQDRQPVAATHPGTELDLPDVYFTHLIQGLFMVVNDGGTGRAAAVPGLDICGKTGTQQIISKENPNYRELVKQDRFRPHAWFVSFAPRENPEIAMVVFVEHGGDAGEVAAPIAAQIYRKLFLQ